MHDLIAPYVEKGLVSRQEHPNASLGLSIYNYTQKCQFGKAWDEITLQCRGLILDADGNIIARPLKKFFNWEEHQGPIPNRRPEVYEKMDGSLFIATLLKGVTPVFATRGSFTSEQAFVGETMMLDCYGSGWMEEGWTYCFEIIYPENRIVVDYGWREDLVLLAKINNATGEEDHIYHDAPEWTGPTAAQFLFDSYTLEDLKSRDVENEEGYVLYWPHEDLRLKVKFPSYVFLHRILTGIHARHVWEYLRDGQSLAPLLELTPDEFHDWLEKTRYELHENFDTRRAWARRTFDYRPLHADRKDFALWTQAQSAEVRPLLFRMMDGKPYDDIIWKQIKPEATRPFRES